MHSKRGCKGCELLLRVRSHRCSYFVKDKRVNPAASDEILRTHCSDTTVYTNQAELSSLSERDTYLTFRYVPVLTDIRSTLARIFHILHVIMRSSSAFLMLRGTLRFREWGSGEVGTCSVRFKLSNFPVFQVRGVRLHEGIFREMVLCVWIDCSDLKG